MTSQEIRVSESRQKWTPPEIAKRFGVSRAKVLAWITSGELRAIDCSTRQGARKRWRIDAADLAEFEAARANRQPASVVHAAAAIRRGRATMQRETADYID